MDIPDQIKVGASLFLQRTLNQDLTLEKFFPCGGGCINNGGKLVTSIGSFFIKWNDAKRYPGMFDAEAKGLALLAESNSIRIPKVVGSAEHDSFQFIILEFIESRARSNEHWEILGRSLARLHKNSSSLFGLDHDNYIGSLPQVNHQKNSWLEFFITHRLNAQLKIGTDSGAIGISTVKKFEDLYKKLPDILTEEKPSLLHGDLWSGNLIPDENGNPCLIDPATYYGNREVDLAMTQLFGGFSDVFYPSYQNEFPLVPGFRERFDICNLYPLLVHVNLFGEGYMAQVNSILKSYV